MRIKSILALLCILASTAYAQNKRPVSLDFEARGDYDYRSIDGTKVKEDCGFKGNVVNIIIMGNLSPEFSFGFRNRLNGINRNYSFFDATDWLYLTYQATKNVSFTAGKMVVKVAGWELSPAPIDCYLLSEFCYNFPCYQWGVMGQYRTNSGKDNFAFQVCQSPYQKQYNALGTDKEDMYAYNLEWTGRHGFFEPMWSANMLEYAPGKFINYISLGNRFHISDNVQVELDLMNRAASHQTFFGKDCSVVCQVSYQPVEKLNIFAKASYEVNKSGTDADVAITDGTELKRISGGVEFFPLKDKKLRIHGNMGYAFGKNTNPNGTVHDKESNVNIGVTWRARVL
ncbi:MAG: porin [Prevotella sp.]|uniref:porin n=1 Tax=Prevotella sp. TaxID=59823 RepID=UPI002A30F47F|nr:porin [Prevotella sp.]MDD7317256.1 porin [Prevotellaceae bacterium]MDY4019860.1 porin [Prevotella sp.]